MLKSSAWLLAGAVVMTAGVAHAQPTAQSVATQATETQASTPWYQRFTTSGGLTESITGTQENDRILPPAWTLNQRWGVTLDVQEAERIERSPDGGRGDQIAAGGYYRFTPSLSVGAQVSLETTPAPGAAPVTREEHQEPRADVRVESAFRF
ncbi:NtrZ family periplasmic regulatory protein [Terricaulis sp.]|uniref:NtrZ family periplasmic regulatory protein n=1 Tax=Terricaulis sp. TaxID=2768686 RepID=UPI0037837A7F